ncbi:nitrate reductase subunit beta [Mobiluncus curtisii]|uniref:nitrate reductase subunit beta n=1 Tax=Mobiluncus curtisii TaxID=2051 RepID=UPI0014706017|nr:nitrate reductase subunit beta [Mobiluncus curtisii]NMW43117.1 nitrate reductase subunit beta [Mobiluncus curtisii]NMW83856.1 nitrate reductase subunit beta [Mobiluncus curtisii]NMW99704.1 nitrate reductase subunit beta [Mobiluncus curtisii]NMX04768.1 nitrate reductase subunit beta [Mobiluncus curtisii]
MKVLAQIAMVMNLDKCIGCHTCSVTCKQAWTNREGTEYVWFNNVETKPGVGYPKEWENQGKYRGGWKLTPSGKLRLRAGGRLHELSKIFANPQMPTIDDYYEPWTYEYEKLLAAPKGSKYLPSARPVKQITGEHIDQPTWGPNWDDDLAGSLEILPRDPILEQMTVQVKAQIQDAFMFYLPRICEHCLNPACVSACPGTAMYKRTEDGIVLVDQNKCRGWRMCVSACPYKKVYFNHLTGKAEKCTLCYPRLEAGEPTVCSETCVGRLRYLGVLLYDADRVGEAAAVRDLQDLYHSQRSLLLDPFDPKVRAAAEANGVPHSWIQAAQESPVYRLISEYEVALPLHPEYRTLPMVWYIPPLSPVVDAVTAAGADGEDAKVLLTSIATMRIPLEYLAGLFTAGDTVPVEKSLRRLAAMRSYMRGRQLGEEPDETGAKAVGMTGEQMEEMYRLLAIAKYDDRFVVPTAGAETPRGLRELGCSLDVLGGPSRDGEGIPAFCNTGSTRTFVPLEVHQ